MCWSVYECLHFLFLLCVRAPHLKPMLMLCSLFAKPTADLTTNRSKSPAHNHIHHCTHRFRELTHKSRSPFQRGCLVELFCPLACLQATKSWYQLIHLTCKGWRIWMLLHVRSHTPKHMCTLAHVGYRAHWSRTRRHISDGLRRLHPSG